ncbi:MAG: CoA-binding protein, partial [Gammaproteobacteria bacterium]
MTHDRNAVRKILDQAKAAGRTALTAPEARGVCEAYGIAVPREGVASSAEQAARLAADIGFPVVMKIVSPQILHKTEAGGVLVGLKSAEQVTQGYATIVGNARKYDAKAEILGVQVQQMLSGGQEVIIGAVTDPAFGKLVAFGLGGILVEVLKDITFRLAPASSADALSMLDGIAAAEILRGVRGAKPVNRTTLANMIERVSALVADFPEISEMDLNPVFATEHGAT